MPCARLVRVGTFLFALGSALSIELVETHGPLIEAAQELTSIATSWWPSPNKKKVSQRNWIAKLQPETVFVVPVCRDDMPVTAVTNCCCHSRAVGFQVGARQF
jgi:hypothetical protein